jgi:glycosyltransferase involved in cell wall biosynthesis
LARFALLGTRGIPANYGGFETFAEELSTRLVARGHRVTVYCRQRHPGGAQFRGVDLVYLPTIRHKYFDTIAHTALSTAHLLFHRYDAVLYCNAANAIFTIFPRLLAMPVALNVDGLERNRKKWNWLARRWYLLSEWLSTRLPSRIVTDAEEIERYYKDRYGASSTFIPYGAETTPVETRDALDRLALAPRQYFLYVSRMEPENNGLLVRESFEKVATPMRLALIGDAPYADQYIAKVRDTKDARIAIPGAIYGQGYKELQSHCFAYIHATEVGGTHPALIEAMGRGALTLYLNTPENAEVAGDAGIPFEHQTLAAAIDRAIHMDPAGQDRFREAARARVRQRYSWDAVTSAYETLLRAM